MRLNTSIVDKSQSTRAVSDAIEMIVVFWASYFLFKATLAEAQNHQILRLFEIFQRFPKTFFEAR